MPKEIIYAFAHLKKAAAMANHELGVLAADKKDLIATVCDEILAKKLDGSWRGTEIRRIILNLLYLSNELHGSKSPHLISPEESADPVHGYP